MIEFGYCIVERGNLNLQYGNNEPHWTEISSWKNFDKKLYLTLESAEEALTTLQSSSLYNNENYYTEFKIVKLFGHEIPN